jgi:membrane protein DedA with SNARE-associated domain
MPLGRFTVLSLIGTLPWVIGLALAGHALGGDWTSVRKGFQYVDYAILALVLAGIVYALVRRRRGARPTDTSADAAIEPPVTDAG